LVGEDFFQALRRTRGYGFKMSQLAILGGTPVRRHPFPHIGDASGRTLGAEELSLLREVIESGKLNRGQGTKVAQLEKEFASFYGAKHCVASTSGTAAIHVALGALNPEPGSEIITAPITDIGTVIPILLQNCIPVFADTDAETLNLDPRDLERKITDRTRAIIPVHLTGAPCDMDPIMQLAERYDLCVIEDCSQAYLTEYKGRRVGTIGHCGCFSLQQSKHITTGDGGLTITNDDRLAERMALFANKGWPHYGQGGRDYVMFGVNYRMTELQAAVALAQLAKLPGVVAARQQRARLLTSLIEGLPGLKTPRVPQGSTHTYWFYPLLLDQKVLGLSTDAFAKALSAEGIPASAHYIGKPIFLYDVLRHQTIYGSSHCPWECRAGGLRSDYVPGACPGSEKGLDDLIVLPMNERFTEDDVRDIAAAIRKVHAALPQLRERSQ